MNHTSVVYLSEDSISHLFTYTLDIMLVINTKHLQTFIEATQLFVELDVTSIQAGPRPCLVAWLVEVSVQDRAWFVPR